VLTKILYNVAMDAARALIVERVKELGLSLSDLSLQVGKNHAYFQQFIKRGVPLRLPEEVRGRAAQVLKIDERQLKAAGSTASAEPPVSNARIGGGVRIATWIPVYGHAVGGKDGEFILNGNQVTEVLAPASLSSVPEAYAVYVVGDSMEPRYFAGETVFINPRLPISRGAFVVAQIASGEDNVPRAYVKRFVSQDARRLRLEQFHPKKILEFPASRVVSVHRIILSGEG
jgi:phage repressor protein C with HTH and peptisase S24 domain